MKKLILLLFILFSFNVFAQKSENKFQSVTFQELQKIIHQNDDVLYVVNFWATWCKPCIEEIPGFMEVNSIYNDNPNFKMIMVSLDSKRIMDTKVKKFIDKHNLDVDVYLLDEESHFTEWMPQIDDTWMGAIPATVLIKNGKKLFFKQFQITQYELEDLVVEGLEKE